MHASFSEIISSNRQVRTPAGEALSRSIVVDLVQLPKEMVKEVVVSDQAIAFLPKDLQKKITKKWLAEIARLTVAPELGKVRPTLQKKIKRVLVAAEHGRAIPLLQLDDCFVSNRMLSTLITEKGSFVSGHRYPLSEKPVTLKSVFSSSSPIGLFGKKEADRELEISRLLVQNGGYNSLVLGYIELDFVTLRKFISDYWKPLFPEVAELLHEQLNKVMNNGDVPVLLIRLSGVSGRVIQSVYRGRVLTDAEKVIDKRFRRAEFAQAVKVWKRELPLNSERLTTPVKIDKKQLLSVFSKIEERKQKLTKEDLSIFLDYIINMQYAEFQVIERLALKHKKYKDLYHSYFSSKDIDLTLRKYDFEFGFKNEESINTARSMGIREITELVHNYMNELASLFSDLGKECFSSQELFELLLSRLWKKSWGSFDKNIAKLME